MRSAGFVIVALCLAACGPAQEPTPPTPPPSEIPSAAAPAAVDAATAAKIAALPSPYNQGDYANGARVFAQCRACHLTEAGAGNRVGPNLHGVIGRKAGSVADFAYSDAMKNSGITWTPDQLNQYLTNPAKFVPGNRMSFIGVRDDADRRDVITYLQIETSK
jgi:cytochrome c